MKLYLDRYGLKISKEEERLKFEWDEGHEEAELHDLEMVILCIGGSISFSALAALGARGTPLHIISRSGEVLSSLIPTSDGRLERRRAQYEAAKDQAAVEHIAFKIVQAKALAQQRLLSAVWRSRRIASPPPPIALPAEGATVESLLGMEGSASALYWQTLQPLVPQEWRFTRRTGRHAQDPFNALLNFLYGILRVRCQSSVRLSGLEPELGFLHSDRPGRPSLVLDLMEPFRPLVADRVAFRIACQGLASPESCEEGPDSILLGESLRKLAAKTIMERFDQEESPGGPSWERAMDDQAERLARALLTDFRLFTPYEASKR